MARAHALLVALLLLVPLLVAALAAPARAQTPLLTGLGGPLGFGTDCLSPNDDGSSAAIDLTPAFPSGLRFFTRTHTVAYVNTNGNITFSEAVPDYTPEAFPVADQPMIAPYWADVDIRMVGGMCMGGVGTGSRGDLGCMDPDENGVWWHLEPGLMIVTWHQVGYFNCNVDKRMNFQLILSAVEGCGGDGDFDVEFRYNQCEWHTGDASGGLDGFCDPDPIFDECVPAQAGFDAGNGVDFVEIMGSRTETIHTILCDESNVDEPGVWRFQIRSGSVICPEAGEECATGRVGACGRGVTQCVGDSVMCLPIIEESTESCDAIDNDCDGRTDEGDDLCDTLEVCDQGVCQPLCFEGGCPAGQECSTEGRCIDAGCDGVVCDAGQRCHAGTCVDACEGIVCPAPTSCFAGRCVDLCSELTCDDCTVCEDGTCVPRCDFTPCGAGQTCTSGGRCVESACASVTCGAGEACVGGTCQDACIGAVCPPGDMCTGGECVRIPPPPPDAGMPDAGTLDAMLACPPGFDCSGGRDGCSCSVPGVPRRGAPLLPIFGLALLGAVAASRRRRP